MGEIECRGMDGSNPLAFLASLGLLRTLSLARPDWDVRMGWRIKGTCFPFLKTSSDLTEEDLLDVLDQGLKSRQGHEALDSGDDIKATPEEYRSLKSRAIDASSPQHRAFADFVGALAGEVVVENNDPEHVQDTAFRTMRGAGNQHFLKIMRMLAKETEREHLDRTLFRPWDYADGIKSHSLRWDPLDYSPHAYRWRDPSADPRRNKSGGMWGANRLAVEGLPLLPVAAESGRLETTGFRGHGANNTYWTWPVWEPPICTEEVRSALAIEELQGERLNGSVLRERGIEAVFRSQRFVDGKFRNFTPGERIL